MKSEEVKRVENIHFGAGVHLILGRYQIDIKQGCDLLSAFFDEKYYFNLNARARVHICHNYGHNLHWKDIQSEMKVFSEKYKNEGFQYFLGTMNPSVIDCMEFKSIKDVHERVLTTAPLKNLPDSLSSIFWQHYNAPTVHVSEILRMEGIW